MKNEKCTMKHEFPPSPLPSHAMILYTNSPPGPLSFEKRGGNAMLKKNFFPPGIKLKKPD
jgi:hypothetical protein